MKNSKEIMEEVLDKYYECGKNPDKAARALKITKKELEHILLLALHHDLLCQKEMLLNLANYKRYLLFMYETYYPAGGFYDCHGSFNTLEQIEEYANDKDREYDRYHVVDCMTGEIVKNVRMND